jgi:hypothetical protein
MDAETIASEALKKLDRAHEATALVGVRIVHGCDGYPTSPNEVVRVDVGVSGSGGWCEGFSIYPANHSPLILPHNAYGVTRGVNPYELIRELRKLADAVERNLGHV